MTISTKVFKNRKYNGKVPGKNSLTNTDSDSDSRPSLKHSKPVHSSKLA